MSRAVFGQERPFVATKNKTCSPDMGLQHTHSAILQPEHASLCSLHRHILDRLPLIDLQLNSVIADCFNSAK